MTRHLGGKDDDSWETTVSEVPRRGKPEGDRTSWWWLQREQPQLLLTRGPLAQEPRVGEASCVPPHTLGG